MYIRKQTKGSRFLFDSCNLVSKGVKRSLESVVELVRIIFLRRRILWYGVYKYINYIQFIKLNTLNAHRNLEHFCLS